MLHCDLFLPQDHLVTFHFFPSDYRFITLPSPPLLRTHHGQRGGEDAAMGETLMEVSTDEKGGAQTQPQATVR